MPTCIRLYVAKQHITILTKSHVFCCYENVTYIKYQQIYENFIGLMILIFRPIC